MNISEVKKYLSKQGLFVDSKLKFLGSGNNSRVYLLTDKKKKYVFRICNNPGIKKNFIRHFQVLEFLDYSKISFTQKPIFLDKKNLIMINQYLDGRAILKSRVSKKDLDKIINQLYQVQSLSYNSYLSFCKKKDYKIEPLKTPLEMFDLYSRRPAKKLFSACPKKDMLKWIEKELASSQERIKKLKYSKKDIILFHGDFTGANILKNKSEIYFIDWDQARYMYSPDYGLSYMFIHYEYFAKNSDYIIKKVSSLSGKKVSDIKNAIDAKILYVKLNDIIWSANMYTELSKDKKPGWRKYLIQSNKRIKEYNLLLK